MIARHSGYLVSLRPWQPEGDRDCHGRNSNQARVLTRRPAAGPQAHCGNRQRPPAGPGAGGGSAGLNSRAPGDQARRRPNAAERLWLAWAVVATVIHLSQAAVHGRGVGVGVGGGGGERSRR